MSWTKGALLLNDFTPGLGPESFVSENVNKFEDAVLDLNAAAEETGDSTSVEVSETPGKRHRKLNKLKHSMRR